MVGGGLATLVLVGAGAFLLTRSADGFLPFTDHDKPPTLSFDAAKVGVETTTPTKAKDVRDVAQAAADQVKGQLETLYYNAFVDPDTWGDPGELDKLFTEDALAKVGDQTDTVTIGKDASDVYDYTYPDKGKVRIKILTDAQDEPAQAVATVLFVATTEHDDGSYSRITSEGSYFLKRLDGEWRIYAFDITKKEKKTDAPVPTPSASEKPSGATKATASGEASP